MPQPKKLIEVAMPVKEISVENTVSILLKKILFQNGKDILTFVFLLKQK